MTLLTEAELAHVRQEFDAGVKRAYAQGVYITHNTFGLTLDLKEEKPVFHAKSNYLCCPTGAYLLDKPATVEGYGWTAAKLLGLKWQQHEFFSGFWLGFDMGLRYQDMSNPYSGVMTRESDEALRIQGRQFGWDYAKHLWTDMPEVIRVRVMGN